MKHTITLTDRDMREAVLEYIKDGGFNIDKIAAGDIQFQYQLVERNQGELRAVITVEEN